MPIQTLDLHRLIYHFFVSNTLNSKAKQFQSIYNFLNTKSDSFIKKLLQENHQGEAGKSDSCLNLLQPLSLPAPQHCFTNEKVFSNCFENGFIVKSQECGNFNATSKRLWPHTL